MTLSSDIQQALFDDMKSSSSNDTAIDWIDRNRSINGKPWKWVSENKTEYGKVVKKDFRYMIPIYLDTHPEIILKKSRQMAVSEYGINWIMNLLDRHDHTTALHIFPKESQGKRFSNLRLTPLFDKKTSPKLYARLKDPEVVYGSAMQAAANVTHKQFVNSTNYVLSFIGGANTKSTDARSVSADFVFLDEAKDLPQENITDVLECMALSDYKFYRMVGTPDFPGTEFDRRYEDSDQREWIVTCAACGVKQQLIFDRVIQPTSQSPIDSIKGRDSNYYYACMECGAELDRSADHSEWVPQNPGSDVHGYHPTQLMASWITADEIMKGKRDNKRFIYKFYNEILGETYSGGSKPLSLPKMLACRVDEAMSEGAHQYITIGVDWGNQSHYMVLGSTRRDDAVILDYGVWADTKVKKHAERAVELIDSWTCDVAVLDSGYGKSQNQAVFEARPGQAYSCFYKESAFTPIFEIVDQIKGEYIPRSDFQYHVTVNHTSMCDTVLDSIDSKELKIPMAKNDELVPGVSDLRDMLDNIAQARIVEIESKGKKWVIKPAHYFAAAAYALIGMDGLYSGACETGAGGADFFIPRGYS